MIDQEWVHLTVFPSKDDASRAGATLLESGIVATLGDGDAERAGEGTSLSVLPDDVERACELLGISEPVSPGLPLEQPLPVESTRWRFPRERIAIFALGYLVVLIGLAVAVFFIVVWLLGGYDSTEMPDVTVRS